MGVRSAAASAVGIAAVFYGGDAKGVFVVMEAHAIVADPQPELRRFDVLETLHVAFAGFQVASQGVQDAESSGLVDRAELSPGLVGPENVLAHAYRPVL